MHERSNLPELDGAHRRRPSPPCRPNLAVSIFRAHALKLGLVVAILAIAQEVPAQDDGEIPFDEAELFFELNDTDGDLGIHSSIDGDPWKRLQIEDPRDRTILNIRLSGRLRKQGLTQLFFESAEPTFDELEPEVFFRRFPEGTYEIEGLTLEGEELESETRVTHLIPAPAELRVNGLDAAEDCDAVLPEVSEPVTVTWEPVTESHPDLGRSGEEIEVVNYEVVAEIDGTRFKTSTILPPSATSFLLPSEILAQRDPEENEVKFEVLVREKSFNQTGVESCFIISD